MSANPELVDYVKQQMKSGYPEQQIRDMLIQTGWQPHEVEDAFREAKMGSASLGIRDEPKQVQPPSEAEAKGRFTKKPETEGKKPPSQELMQKPLFEEKKGLSLGFLLTMIAGALIIFNGVYFAYLSSLTGDILTAWNMTITLLTLEGTDLLFGILNIAIGALIIVFYLILSRMEKPLMAGVLVLALSAVALVSGGFFVGAGVGIVAGIAVILKK